MDAKERGEWDTVVERARGFGRLSLVEILAPTVLAVDAEMTRLENESAGRLQTIQWAQSEIDRLAEEGRRLKTERDEAQQQVEWLRSESEYRLQTIQRAQTAVNQLAEEDARKLQERLDRVVEENKRLSILLDCAAAEREGASRDARQARERLDMTGEENRQALERLGEVIEEKARLQERLDTVVRGNKQLRERLSEAIEEKERLCEAARAHEENCECVKEAAETRYTAAEVRGMLCQACAAGVKELYDRTSACWEHCVNGYTIPCLASDWRKVTKEETGP